MDLMKILLVTILVNNIILMRFIALCSYIGMTNDVGQSVGMGFAVTFVTVLATCRDLALVSFRAGSPPFGIPADPGVHPCDR